MATLWAFFALTVGSFYETLELSFMRWLNQILPEPMAFLIKSIYVVVFILPLILIGFCLGTAMFAFAIITGLKFVDILILTLQ